MLHRNIVTKLYKLASDKRNKELVIDIANNYITELEKTINDCKEKIDNYKMLIDELESEGE